MTTPLHREARDIMAYLKKYSLADQLNTLVNKLCKKKSEDPFGFLAARLRGLAAPASFSKIEAREIIAADGVPALEVDLYCKVEEEAKFIVRAIASPEKKFEFDGSSGFGLSTVATEVSEELTKALAGLKITARNGGELKTQLLCDSAIIKTKEKLPNMALEAVSVAICKAAAKIKDYELFSHISRLDNDGKDIRNYTVPRPMVQLINAEESGLIFPKEICVFPLKSKSFKEQFEQCVNLHKALGNTLGSKFGGSFSNTTSSGGYCPPVSDINQALKLIVDSADNAGIKLGEDLGLCICAGDWKKGYKLSMKESHPNTSEDMIRFYIQLLKRGGIGAIMNPLEPSDFEGWSKLKTALLNVKELEHIIVIGKGMPLDDVRKIQKSADGLVVAFDEETGTVSDIVNLAKTVKESKLVSIVSSSETDANTETFLADLAVGMGAMYVKFGGARGSQNLCKYNRILQISSLLT
mmetsp:Transcript_21939/g.32692  ORF Transcript_21939/g.32692 Transcript_21939/m.32692 type:complete len:468 (-) Transcript_21939:67-1470(-)